MVGAIKEWLAVIREALIICAILLVLLFPARVGAWLWNRGVQKIEVAGATVSLEQFRQTRDALNEIQTAQNLAPERAQAPLQNAATRLQQTLADQVRTITAQDPNAVPRVGWIYLGTLDPQKSGWKPGLPVEVKQGWPVGVGDVVTLTTDVNLRADSASDEHPAARILSVLPQGTRARILDLDAERPVPANSTDGPGFRAWARVDATS